MFRKYCQPSRGRRSSAWRLSFIACLLLLVGLGGTALAQPFATRSGPATVVFQLEAEAGRTALEACHQVWQTKGPQLTAAIWPWSARADTVLCVVLGTKSFQRSFAGRLPDWGVGLAVPGGRLIALDYERLPAVGRSVREVFLHEMTHALLFQGTRGAWLPTWFHEGVAMQLSGDWRFIDTVSVVLDGHLPALGRLSGPFPRGSAGADRAYRTSLLAVEYLQRQYGTDIALRLVAATAHNGNFAAAFREVTGDEVEVFAARFAGSMKLKYGWLLLIFRWPTLFVIMALLFALGAIRRIVNKRRQMADLDDDVELD